jgi:hypothetical protein
MIFIRNWWKDHYGMEEEWKNGRKPVVHGYVSQLD